MNYIISSLGRAERMITLESMPARCLQHITLMVRPEELKIYKNQWYSSKVRRISTWPEEVDCIAKKRKWLGEELGASFTLIDDDLSMYVFDRKLSKFVLASNKPKTFIKEFEETFPALFDHHKSVSLPMKLFSDQAATNLLKVQGDLVKNNQLGYVFSGYQRGALSGLNHNVFVFTDLNVSLQQFMRSGSSVVYYGMCFQQSGAKFLQSSGMSLYRSDLIKLDSALKMMKLYPGIITNFKANSEANGGGVSVSKQVRRVGRVTEAHLKTAAQTLKGKLAEYGLTKVPKIFTIEYDIPRAKLEAVINKNWKKVQK